MANRSDAEGTVAMLVAEYSALRSEIGRYQDHQKDLVNFSLVALAAILTLAGTLNDVDAAEDRAKLATAWLALPLVHWFLAGAYAERARRVMDIAKYLDGPLKSGARELSVLPVFNWESFKSDLYRHDRPGSWFGRFWKRHHWPASTGAPGAGRDASLTPVVPIIAAFMVPAGVELLIFVFLFPLSDIAWQCLVALAVYLFLMVRMYKAMWTIAEEERGISSGVEDAPPGGRRS